MNTDNKRKKIIAIIIIIAVIVACIGGYAGCSKSKQVDSKNAEDSTSESLSKEEEKNNVEDKYKSSLIAEAIRKTAEASGAIVGVDVSESVLGSISEVEEDSTVDQEAIVSSEPTTSSSETTSKDNSSSGSSNSNTTTNNKSSNSSSSGSGSSSNSNSSSSSSSSSSNSSSSKPTHTHDWVEQTTTVTVPAVTHMEDQGWDEEIPGEKGYKCGCGEIFSTLDEWREHQFSYSDVGDFSHPDNYTKFVGKSSYIHHENWVEVVDTPEHTETYWTGVFKCSICGATK